MYKLAASYECNERTVRLEYSQGSKEQAKIMLESMIDDPASDTEYLFATDFYSRKEPLNKSSVNYKIYDVVE